MEPHTGGFCDVADLDQILPRPVKIALRPPESGTGEIAARDFVTLVGPLKCSDGGIRFCGSVFVAGKCGDTGQTQTVEAYAQQLIVPYCIL